MRQAYRFVKWCLTKIVKAATEKLWNLYEDEHWFIGLAMTFAIWISGIFVTLVIHQTTDAVTASNIAAFAWTVMWVTFAVTRLVNLAWQEFIREQNRLFERLKENHYE